MLNTRLVTWALGIAAAISFVLCVIYGLLTPRSLHSMGDFLEMVLPAFKWLTWWGFLLGLVESFLYGVYAGLVYCLIYNWLYRHWGSE
jgi:FtsH-binding integral membrane protein